MKEETRPRKNEMKNKYDVGLVIHLQEIPCKKSVVTYLPPIVGIIIVVKAKTLIQSGDGFG